MMLLAIKPLDKKVIGALWGSRKYPYHPPPTEGVGFSRREGGSICLIFQWAIRLKKVVICSNGLGYPFEKICIHSNGLGYLFEKEFVDRSSDWNYLFKDKF